MGRWNLEVGTSIVTEIIIVALSLGIGAVIGSFVKKRLIEKELGKIENIARETLDKAQREAETKRKELLIEAKEALYKAKADFEEETKEKRQELQRLERKIAQKEENIERKINFLDNKEREILNREKRILEQSNELKEKEKKYERLIAEELKKLEIISGISAAEAKEELKEKIMNEARIEAANTIKRLTEEAKREADTKAREILSLAIQRCAADHITETAVTVVDLPNDDMKGRIIGREGRNIRALEMATGIDLIIDDTPEAIVLSGFDPIRREIARISLERLMADGRIHPGRIEEVVNKVKKDMNNIIRAEGEQAALEAGVDGLHPEEIKLLGRLRYRTSYSQNVLQHSKEVANLCGIIAAELGADVKTAKRAGLLHDIGKAVDHQTEGTHTQIGAELAAKYGEPKIIVDAITSHHEDVEASSIEAVILQAADALSAARPGARREMVESYIKRLEKLEHIADSFNGVEKAFAIRAGREIRIIVHPEKIADAEMVYLSQDIAKKIEEELAYPGEIKVTVIRETRAIEYAR
jgi:ribonuclease Y